MSAIFQTTIETLLKQMGIDAQAVTASQSMVYSLRIDGKLEVHLIGEHEGFLHIWCFPGELPEKPSIEALQVLLYGNNPSFSYPTISIGLDQPSHKVSLWVRHPLAELDTATLHHLFVQFVETAERLQTWLVQSNDGSSK